MNGLNSYNIVIMHLDGTFYWKSDHERVKGEFVREILLLNYNVKNIINNQIFTF